MVIRRRKAKGKKILYGTLTVKKQTSKSWNLHPHEHNRTIEKERTMAKNENRSEFTEKIKKSVAGI